VTRIHRISPDVRITRHTNVVPNCDDLIVALS
jgi:hypothetical protein